VLEEDEYDGSVARESRDTARRRVPSQGDALQSLERLPRGGAPVPRPHDQHQSGEKDVARRPRRARERDCGEEAAGRRAEVIPRLMASRRSENAAFRCSGERRAWRATGSRAKLSAVIAAATVRRPRRVAPRQREEDEGSAPDEKSDSFMTRSAPQWSARPRREAHGDADGAVRARSSRPRRRARSRGAASGRGRERKEHRPEAVHERDGEEHPDAAREAAESAQGWRIQTIRVAARSSRSITHGRGRGAARRGRAASVPFRRVRSAAKRLRAISPIESPRGTTRHAAKNGASQAGQRTSASGCASA